MYVYILLCCALFSLADAKSESVSVLEYPKPLRPCNAGDVIENECSTCVCQPPNEYVCTDKVCVRNKTEEAATRASDKNSTKCDPNMLYQKKQSQIICLCTPDGHWPHEKCDDVFSRLLRKKTQITFSCEPNSYVTVDCNICRCDSRGVLDKEHCTKNVCENEAPAARRSGTSNVFGDCEPKTWYSLAPCQFCFCGSKNKLVCNTGNNDNKVLQLGAYNLTVCNKGLIKEAMDLIPENLKGKNKSDKNDFILRQQPSRTTPSITNVDHNLVIDVEHEELEKNEEDVANRDDGESSTEVEETDTPKAGRAGRTKNRDASVEYGGSASQERAAPRRTTTPVPLTKEPSDPSVQNLGKVVKFNWPAVLQQVFKMGLRKSMLSLRTDVKCHPETEVKVDCNTCYCMKNGKVLCTNKLC